MNNKKLLLLCTSFPLDICGTSFMPSTHCMREYMMWELILSIHMVSNQTPRLKKETNSSVIVYHEPNVFPKSGRVDIF